MKHLLLASVLLGACHDTSVVGGLHEAEAHQGRARRIEAPLAICHHQSVELLCLRLRRQRAPIQEIQGKIRAPLHDLQRASKALPGKPRPEHRVTGHDVLPRARERADVQGTP